ANNLSRWVDLKPKEKAGGLTYIGPERGKKRSWMINLTNINVLECHAVIIATPSPEAYGVLQTAQDETPARRIIRQIDNVHYDDRISLAATYDRPSPDWKGIRGENSRLAWIDNESAKRGVDDSTGLLLQSTDRFSQDHENTGDEEVTRQMLEIASDIVGPWVFKAQSTYLHRWKFFRPRNPLNDYFIELEMIDAPLALVGNYFGGTSLENAYLSGYNLAEYWINKYSDVTVAWFHSLHPIESRNLLYIKSLSSLRKLNKYFKKYKVTIILGSLFLTTSNFFLVWIPVFLRKTIDQVSQIETKDSSSFDSIINVLFYSEASWPLAKNAFLLVGAVILSGGLLFATRQTLIVASRKMEFDLRNDIFDKLLKLPQRFYSKYESGEVYVRATEDVSKVREYFGPAYMYTINTLTRAGFII